MALNIKAPLYEIKHLSKNDFITELYQRYGKKLYAYAIHQWHLQEDDCWDLIYKTLYKVIDSYRNYTFETEEKFASYVFKIFINYLRNHYRDHQKDSENMKQSDIESAGLHNRADTPASEASPGQKLLLLNEELDKMEDWQRILLLMRSDGSAYAEIAKYVNKPEEQLKVYYQRLKEQITKKLNERL